jgi:hypothetical protein
VIAREALERDQDRDDRDDDQEFDRRECPPAAVVTAPVQKT